MVAKRVVVSVANVVISTYLAHIFVFVLDNVTRFSKVLNFGKY